MLVPMRYVPLFATITFLGNSTNNGHSLTPILSGERIEPHCIWSTLGFPQSLRSFRIADIPTPRGRATNLGLAVMKFHKANDYATDKIIARDIRDAISI